MTVVEHRKFSSDVWAAEVDDRVFEYRGGDTLYLKTRYESSLYMHFPMGRWPACRDAMDALYKVWEEQQALEAIA